MPCQRGFAESGARGRTRLPSEGHARPTRLNGCVRRNGRCQHLSLSSDNTIFANAHLRTSLDSTRYTSITPSTKTSCTFMRSTTGSMQSVPGTAFDVHTEVSTAQHFKQLMRHTTSCTAQELYTYGGQHVACRDGANTHKQTMRVNPGSSSMQTSTEQEYLATQSGRLPRNRCRAGSRQKTSGTLRRRRWGGSPSAFRRCGPRLSAPATASRPRLCARTRVPTGDKGSQSW